MAGAKLVLTIDTPNLHVKVHKDLLEVDLKKGIRKMLEDVVEAHPTLRETVGVLFQTTIPLDVPIKEIDSVTVDKKGNVKITLPLRRDIVIPLEKQQAEKLIAVLNELIPVEKDKEYRRILAQKEAEREAERWKLEGLKRSRRF